MEAAFQSGIASASLQVILERFATFALNEIGLILGVDDELRKLEKTLLKIQALVDLVEDSHAINNTKAWQVWLEDLKKLSYDADDLLDEISLELSRFKSKSHPQIYTNKTQVRDMVFSTFKLGLPHEISKLQKELEGIASEMDSFSLTQLIKFGFPRRDMGIQLGSTSCGSSSVSVVDEMNLIGREKQKEEIVEMLLTEDDSTGLGFELPVYIYKDCLTHPLELSKYDKKLFTIE
ncbi:putative disease resistance protein RGA3 [Camellia lanceoleosa]|uniref:Disease resistance protein RGA3 n=1 Tax=Camellia lanceoleosa TaxID=1840588 RepID=A0ACC0FR95_9ERIC|nr:putative disease resistance protein RGA3 [Camellia lanceoleosa]